MKVGGIACQTSLCSAEQAGNVSSCTRGPGVVSCIELKPPVKLPSLMVRGDRGQGLMGCWGVVRWVRWVKPSFLTHILTQSHTLCLSCHTLHTL